MLSRQSVAGGRRAAVAGAQASSSSGSSLGVRRMVSSSGSGPGNMRELMSYDEAVAVRVRRILSRRRDVVEKRMVGGLSFIVRGSMCCGVTGDRLMVRVGPEARERILAKPHTEPLRFAGRSLAGFICV